jgi:hypothetical protein
MINVEIRLSEARAHRLWGYRKYQMNRIQLGGTDRNRMTSGYNSSPIQMQIKYVLIKVTYIFNNTCTPKSANFNGVRAITLSARPNLTRKTPQDECRHGTGFEKAPKDEAPPPPLNVYRKTSLF